VSDVEVMQLLVVPFARCAFVSCSSTLRAPRSLNEPVLLRWC
jgi:hypothetical protein